MGVIHLAEQSSLMREVAVKTCLANAPSVLQAVIREARILGSLEHPNLVPVHALGLPRTSAAARSLPRHLRPVDHYSTAETGAR
jgi:hypothetical protein